jgi:hypothetical protein
LKYKNKDLTTFRAFREFLTTRSIEINGVEAITVLKVSFSKYIDYILISNGVFIVGGKSNIYAS